MLMTKDEKKRLADLEWRKRKIIEEEQSCLNDFNADQRRLLIFSHIFRIVFRLKFLSKRMRGKLKPRVMLFSQKFVDENKAVHANQVEITKAKHQKSNVHLSLFHHHKSRYMQKQVSEALFRSYVANLKSKGFKN